MTFADLPKEVHKEISRKGGINSGISRARTKVIEAIITEIMIKQILGDGSDHLDIGDEIIRLSELSNEDLVKEVTKLGEDPEMIERQHEADNELNELLDIGDLLE